MDRIEAAIAGARPPEMVGYHKLRARTAGSRRYIELHVQFRDGTTPRAGPRRSPTRSATPSSPSSRDAEVLIHVEPEASARDPPPSPSPTAPAEGVQGD